ncbi:hypothetical protein [Croceicoccus sp. BE223]|uniref:hypothetical protein n=1 Tax=Croceicoccus sp. BE223 TaxID=2817716 RepID=UPI002864CF39|nr:hypothetical protein [Croceicoccus sp. BE223]MDR7101953.1 hypothetical protein [Croceicoccus sp. BE223]
MTYRPLSPLDARTRERWRGTAFGRIQSGPYAGRIISIVEFSETGCRLRDHDMACEAGDVFHMTLEDIGPMVADVRWKNGAFIGISFRQKLTETVLRHLRELMDEPLQIRLARMMSR